MYVRLDLYQPSGKGSWSYFDDDTNALSYGIRTYVCTYVRTSSTSICMRTYSTLQRSSYPLDPDRWIISLPSPVLVRTYVHILPSQIPVNLEPVTWSSCCSDRYELQGERETETKTLRFFFLVGKEEVVWEDLVSRYATKFYIGLRTLDTTMRKKN